MKMSFLLMTLIFPNCSSSLTLSLRTLFFAPCGVSGALAVSNRTVDEASFVYEYQFLFFGKRLHREEKKKATSISLSHLSSVLLVACNRGNSAFRKHTSEEEEEERARSKACKTEHAIKCQRKFIISQIPSCIYIYWSIVFFQFSCHPSCHQNVANSIRKNINFFHRRLHDPRPCDEGVFARRWKWWTFIVTTLKILIVTQSNKILTIRRVLI